MTQLIINGTSLPETRWDKYKCYPVSRGEKLRMLSGRLVEEVGYNYLTIEYEFDYLPDSVLRPLLAALRSGRDLNVMYLPDNAAEQQRGIFKCTRAPTPVYAFSRGGAAFWHNVSFTLEEVSPSD